MTWTVILQYIPDLDGVGQSQCWTFAVPGMHRPVRILLVADEPHGARIAEQIFVQLKDALTARTASFGYQECGSARIADCKTTLEPSCHHLLVPVIGRTPATLELTTLCQRWGRWNGHIDHAILPVTPPTPHPAHVFPTGSNLNTLQGTTWSCRPDRLVAVLLNAALLNRRGSLFVSYRRDDAAQIADQLFDSLNRCGYRVFIDRFSVKPGRPFPRELAEEIAATDVLLLLESPKFHQSPWTLWEVALARQYHMGIIALDLDGPATPGVQARYRPALTSTMTLTAPDQVAAAIDREFGLAALARRAYLETEVAAAALASGRTVGRAAHGVLNLLDTGRCVGHVLPAGKPGTARNLRHLVQVGTGTPMLLAGQHAHMDDEGRADLTWMAGQNSVRLIHPSQLRREVTRLP